MLDSKTAKIKAKEIWKEVFYDKGSEVWLVEEYRDSSWISSVCAWQARIIIRKSDGKVLAVWHV